MTPSRKNKQDTLPDHSKEKILVYKTYLEEYLRVMCNQEYWNNIRIWEPFAGPGIYKDGSEGSPMEAVKVIQEMSKKHPEKNIKLFVNELNPESVMSLRTALEKGSFPELVDIEQGQAEIFLKNKLLKIAKRRFSHNLIFIDPYGYKDINSRTLREVISLRNCDYLIFIPTNHIYRFISDPDGPAEQFLLALNASKDDIESFSDAAAFVKGMEEILKRESGKEYVYSYKLRNDLRKNSYFHLFFITQHLTGVEKFFVAIKKIDRKKGGQFQVVLDHDTRVIVKNIIKDNGKIDNQKLCELCLISGHLQSEVGKALRKLEKSNDLEVIDPTGKRQRGGYYLDLNQPKVKLLFRLSHQA